MSLIPCCKAVVPKLKTYQNNQEDLWKYGVLDPTTSISDSLDLGWE